ncbi:MAG: hypothetical protein U0136_10480 [Bdellovibrionota bacterium]
MSQSSSPTIVQLVAIDETGDSYYRMRWPARELAAQAPDWRIINLDARAQERFRLAEEADLLVIYQSHDLDLLPVIRRRKAAGKRTLVEYNDNFYAPPPSAPVAEAWGSPVLWQAYERFMHESDGVIVTGPGLRELLSSKTKTPIHILENLLPFRPSAFEELCAGKTDRINLSIAGSLGHMPDYLAVMPIVRQLLVQFPQITLHVMGNESLPTLLNLPAERLRFTPWGAMEQYYDFLKSVHIGLAPLLDTPYNRCRSDVKALELSAFGACPVVTKALPYQQFLAKTQAPAFGSLDELSTLIAELIEHPDNIQTIASRCHEYVSRERLGHSRAERKALYEAMLPKACSSFSWPVGVGSHELAGTQGDLTSEAKVLASAQDLARKNDHRAALKALVTALDSNPDLSTVAYAELKLLLTLRDIETFAARFRAHRERFPYDLRFEILGATLETDGDNQLRAWSLIARRLRTSSRPYRNFFRAAVLAAFLDQLEKQPILMPLADVFLEIYPNHAPLHFMLAKLLESVGRTEEALRHAQWLIDFRDTADLNRDLSTTPEQAYLHTWAESLAGIVQLQKKN